MKRSAPPAETPGLFDAPLRSPEPPSELPAAGATESPEPSQAFFDDEPSLFDTEPPSPEDLSPTPPSRWSLARRTVGAYLLDLIVLVSALVVAVGGMSALGVPPRLELWPAVAVFLLSFSFLYNVVPLAFWGQTPGMARAGLVARSRDGAPLSFGQTGLRWLGFLLTLGTAGLPWLAQLLGAPDLSDLLSGSITSRK